jgi:hypothetical protein
MKVEKQGLVAKRLPLVPPSGKMKKASASELAKWASTA